MDLSAATAAIAAALAGRRAEPILVAVDGHSAAGKSTVATALAAEVGAVVVPGDDFYRVMDDADRAALTPALGADRYYDWQRLDAEVLAPLAAGRRARYRPYDWSTGELGAEPREIPPAPLVLVEGLFVGRSELRHRFAVSIVVVTDPSIRRERQAARADATQAWLDRWDAAERHHFSSIRPIDSFDVVIDGSP